MTKWRYKYVWDSRLVWLGKEPDEQWWNQYFSAQDVDVKSYLERFENNPIVKRVIAWMEPELDHSGRYIEAGCGLGGWVYTLGKKGVNVVGIELSSQIVEAVKRQVPHLQIFRGNVLHLPWKDESLDGYLSFGVVEHFSDGPERALIEANRVLKIGGLLVISVPYFGFTRWLLANVGRCPRTGADNLAFYQYGFQKTELRNIIQQCGFVWLDELPIGVDRLLREEIRVFAWIRGRRGGRWLRKIVESVLEGRDGHMLVVKAKKVDRVGAAKTAF